MNLNPRKIEFSQVAAAEADFWDKARVDPETNDEVFKSLRDFFATQPAPLIYNDYYWGYWRWFIDLTQARLGTMESADFTNWVMGKQTPAALALGYDVWDTLIWHLHFRTPFTDDMANVYTAMRKAFFESDAVVGMYKGQLVAVRDLIPEIKKINDSITNTLQTAEIMSKIQSCFANHSNRPELINYFVKPEIATDRFVGLVNFFLGVEPNRVWYVVDEYVHASSPKPEEGDEESGEENVDNTVEALPEAVENEPVNSVPAEVETVAPTEEPPAAPAMSYVDIKNMVEARFTRDATGEFTNLDGVLALLETLANDQGDDQIRELYYFDEGAGKFQWNDALLT